MTLRAFFQVGATALASLVSGAAVGVIAGIYHAALFPWGLVAILFALGAGLMGLRVFFAERYPAVLASAGLMLALVALAGNDGQDSVLIAGNAAGLSLIAGVAFCLIAANAWPAPKRVLERSA